MGVTAGATFSLATPRPVALPCFRPIERGHKGPSAYTLPALDQATAHCTWGTQPRAGGFCQGLCVYGAGSGCGLVKSDIFSSWSPLLLPPCPAAQALVAPGTRLGASGEGESCPHSGNKGPSAEASGGGAGRRRALRGGAHMSLATRGTVHPQAQCPEFPQDPTPGSPRSAPSSPGGPGSPWSGTGIPGRWWRLPASASAGTRSQAAAGGAGAQPASGRAAPGRMVQPCGPSALGAAWVPCLKGPRPHPPPSPSPAHSCSHRQRAWWAPSSGQTATETPGSALGPQVRPLLRPRQPETQLRQDPRPGRSSPDQPSPGPHHCLSFPTARLGLSLPGACSSGPGPPLWPAPVCCAWLRTCTADPVAWHWGPPPFWSRPSPPPSPNDVIS